MASVGQGAALGLESGFRLAMDMHARQRQDERMDRQEARQAGLDSQAQQDREYARQRQSDADEMNAVTMQRSEFAKRQQALVDAGTKLTPEQEQAMTAEGEGINAKHQALLVKHGAYDPTTVARTAAAAADALKNGDMDYFAKNPGAFSQAVTSTGFAPQDYRPGPNQEPPLVKQGATDLTEGMQTGDQARTINGANIMFRSEVRQGIGGEGAHGGKIIDKRIVGMVPDPNSTPDDPRVIPTLRVYVNNGKAEASGDEVRARRAMDDPNAPPGATGHYDAPMTLNRSTDPNDPVKSLSIKDALDRVGQQMHMLDVMNTPQADQLLAHDAQSGWDGQRFLDMRASYGVQAAPKTTTTTTPIPAGGSLYEKTTDNRGRVIGTNIVQGNQKQFRSTLAQEVQDYADANDMTLAQAGAIFQKAGLTKQPSKYSAGGGGGGGGGGGEGEGGDGLTKAQKRQYDVGNKALENRSTTLDRKEQRERDDYKNDLDEVKPDPMGDLPAVAAAKAKRRAELKAEHAKVVAAHDAEREEIKNARLTLEANSQGTPTAKDTAKPGLQPPVAAAGKTAPAPAGKLTKDAAAAKFGF